MAHKQIHVRNNRTGKDYVLGQEGWDNLGRLKMQSRFTIIEERLVSDTPKATFIPGEIEERTKRLSVENIIDNNEPRASRPSK